MATHYDSRKDYIERFKKDAKEHLEEYVGTVTPSAPRSGRHAYICPCCHSGEGNNGHFTAGFNIFRGKDGEMRFKCLACGISGDIFTLAGLVNNTDSFREQMGIVAHFLNVDIEHCAPLGPIEKKDMAFAPSANAEEQRKLKAEARVYIAECEKNIGRTDYFGKRGFSEEIIKQFHLGYDPKKRMAVIPFTRSYYVGRSTIVGRDESGAFKHYKPKDITQPVFNMEALGYRRNPNREPVFVCEAPIDAMSIVQSGGQAMATGGTAFSMLCRVLKTYRPDLTFILAFDNDEKGQIAERRLAQALDDVQARYIHLNGEGVFGRYKDANEALLTDPHGLRESVAAAINRALGYREQEKLSTFSKEKTDLMGMTENAKMAERDSRDSPSSLNGHIIERSGNR